MDKVRDLVAAGGVSAVLAQDRDRFAREPAYHYLLRREFEERGTKIRALNDRGDESPEGALTDGILDQLAKYERSKIAERSRRGKLQKARQGKVVAGPLPNFGFGYNAGRDNYVVDEEQMRVIRRIFREVGAEGRTMYAVKRDLDREGVVAPWGGRFWSLKYIRNRINDVYGPTPSRIREELAVRHALTTVRMRAFGEEELEAYARLGEGVGKAGGYAIQGRAAAFVEWIGGDYTNVVGLPLALTVRMLAGFGINWY